MIAASGFAADSRRRLGLLAAAARVVLRLAAGGEDERERRRQQGREQHARDAVRGHAFSSCDRVRCAAARGGHGPRCRDEWARASRARWTRLGPSTEPTSSTPGDDLDPVRRDRLAQRQRLLDAAEQEQGEDDADDRAAAAEDRHAAEHDRGDRGQLEALADVRRGGRVAQRDDDAGQRGDRRPEATNSVILIRLTRMPEKYAASSLAPIAKTERPNGVACRTTPKADGEDREQHHRVGDERAAEVPERAVGPRRREVGHRVVADDDEGQPAEQRQRADRHGQRGQPEAGDEQAVERAAQRADDEADRDDRLDRLAVVPQPRHHRARQGEHRGDGQVDLRGDDDERQRQRHERDLGEVQRAGGERVGGQELRRDRLADEREHDEQPQDQRLPAPEQRAPGGPARGSPAVAPRRAGTASAGAGGVGRVSRHVGRSSGGGRRPSAGR